MNFNQLWIFYNVAKHKSFSSAAEALFLTQPAISTQVKLLENYYKIRLFDRYGKKIKLTCAGEVLFSYAEKILNLIKEADSVIEDIKGTNSGILKISASLTMGTYYLPNILSIFKRMYPNIEIQMMVGNSEGVIENVLSFNSDLGFIGHMVSHEKLIITPSIEEELVIIVSPSHEFASQKAIKLSKLNGQYFILREKGSGTREEVEGKLKMENVVVKVIMELGSNEAIKRAVEAGLGISIISANVVEREVDAGLLKMVRLSPKKIKRNFYIIYHRDKYLSSIIRSFLQMTSEFSRGLT
jgi:DNA-binding transcriptional LysR family regulator